jgi:hypothetical protein
MEQEQKVRRAHARMTALCEERQQLTRLHLGSAGLLCQLRLFAEDVHSVQLDDNEPASRCGG